MRVGILAADQRFYADGVVRLIRADSRPSELFHGRGRLEPTG